ncbi:YueI family protein [Salipaludibacillus agaradhaerens]|uniref:YueI family protein n=1 Tax=Salipaludibacillus agaradhaerens TaxID=76935 RepID=A0A9Q4B1N6_SALAG|nr:YueI family protein [Salipaludibacillus agaradhaerens]UJW57516.1 YueI family protein [Bacillus sp. A116_S68]MCR6096718.1 YueI family protein [Salipaludibacillus agaradhaerens]MCR6106377.1 YueI family protein [Salipaludibacillus agaradhaerens]MCR6113723.1 YueI family protein [Salipaludibacillus agaradhaerens]MCR6118410.1 YueI family protein [Salipaludibacillus agaradhaerens]
MSNEKLEDILKKGMYGTPQLRPEERKLFLSSFAERVYLALTKSQVRHRGIYPEAETMMTQQKNAKLLINGGLSYHEYSNYIQTANKHHIPFTIVNDGRESPLGIVLAADSPVNREDSMFVKDDLYHDDMS